MNELLSYAIIFGFLGIFFLTIAFLVGLLYKLIEGRSMWKRRKDAKQEKKEK